MENAQSVDLKKLIEKMKKLQAVSQREVDLNGTINKDSIDS